MALAIGIDVGGTKILGGIVDDHGQILVKARRNTPSEGGATLISAIADLANELRRQSHVVAVGLSIAGFVSSDRSTMFATPNIAGLDGVKLRQPLESAIGLPVRVENDANSAAWGESVYGAGRGCDHLMLLTIGTGIGGGIITNGDLYRGAHGVAAEFGHMRMVPNGLRCGCGSDGCFEKYASGSALARIAKELATIKPDQATKLLALGDGTIDGIHGSHITEAALAGDQVALDAFGEMGDWLGAGIATLSVVLDPERVIIGGGVIEAGDLLLTPTRNALMRNLPYAAKRPAPSIVPAELGNDAGLVGVADLSRL
ncbi:MAG TPA: ROK family glucokinase [Candidatus Nanopelagicaceae bacterium]|nr:ROK family glucokinase [Candidatus Nanopelagicaceae bacterium]